jgi:AcrR family transcriptional regulator
VEHELGKREAHKEQTRAALLRAAERLFAESGFQATTVRAIADSAGVTERTFFRYFASKDDLVANDMSEWLAKLEKALHSTDPSLPVLVALEQAILATLDEPGPVAGWLFPSDTTGVPGAKTSATSGVAALIAEIIVRWLPASDPSQVEGSAHPVAARRVIDRFHATVLARVGVGIVRTAIVAASQTAALNGHSANLEDIKAFVVQGFALVASDSVEPRGVGLRAQ